MLPIVGKCAIDMKCSGQNNHLADWHMLGMKISSMFWHRKSFSGPNLGQWRTKLLTSRSKAPKAILWVSRASESADRRLRPSTRPNRFLSRYSHAASKEKARFTMLYPKDIRNHVNARREFCTVIYEEDEHILHETCIQKRLNAWLSRCASPYLEICSAYCRIPDPGRMLSMQTMQISKGGYPRRRHACDRLSCSMQIVQYNRYRIRLGR